MDPALAVADPALVISRDTCGDDLFEELFAIRHKTLIKLKEEGGGEGDTTPQTEKKKAVAKKKDAKAEKEKEMKAAKEVKQEKEKEKEKEKENAKEEEEAAVEVAGVEDDDEDLYGDLGGGEDLYGDLNTSTTLEDSMVLDEDNDKDQNAAAEEAAQKAQKEEQAIAAARTKMEHGDQTDSAHLPLEFVPYALQNSSTARFEQISHSLGGKGASTLFLSLSSRLKGLFSGK